nr:unnamed protein product [Callosobruchus analis]
MTKTDGYLRGNAVWKDYEHTNRIPGRTWQSLKERFIKHIAPNILHDKYRTPLWARKLILVGWVRSAQNYKPANKTKSWEELFQLVEQSGIRFENVEDSGTSVSRDCKQIYEEMVQEKTHRYIIFHIKDEREIDVQFVGARNEDYDEFLTDLQASLFNLCL